MRFIGSKRRLLNAIKTLLERHTWGGEESFLDLFAGTNAVARYFKPDYTILTNDILYFSYVNARALIENNALPGFAALRAQDIANPLEYLSTLGEDEEHGAEIGYYEANYSPQGNSQCMYLTAANARRIDRIREQLEAWRHAGCVNAAEYFYLLNALIESIPFVSNITGTYGAFLKHWDKRACNALHLEHFDIVDNGRVNRAYNEDANRLVRKIGADITYIDIPYNTRQYAPNYHLLENVARHTKPQLRGVTRMFDWQELRSCYSNRRHALECVDDLLGHLQTTHIIFSYNNEGIIAEQDLLTLFKKYAYNSNIDYIKIPYRKYKSKTVYDTQTQFYEMLFYIQKKPGAGSGRHAASISPRLMTARQYVKSPLNYIGSKYRLLSQLLPLFPSEIHTFVDLFSGGANVGINAPARRHVFNDMNCLINGIFRYLQHSDPLALVKTIRRRIAEFQLSKTNAAGYLRLRESYNAHPNPLDLYILSCYSYNYQLRFNSRHEFNNPFGRNRSHFSASMESHLLTFMARLHSIDAIFTDQLFQEFDTSTLLSRDFVYLDPPYLITCGSYNDGSRGFADWRAEQEQQLYRLLIKLDQQGIRFALSNVLEHKGRVNDMLLDFVQERHYTVHQLQCSYKNASYNTARQDSREVVITNY